MMRILVILVLTAAAVTSSSAQTMSVGPITKSTYCVGDTMMVPYQTSGTFANDNYFYVELSDSDGSFTKYVSSATKSTLSSGSIPVALRSTGSHYRVCIASADPYLLSQDNRSDIVVQPIPAPIINVRRAINGTDYHPPHDYAVGFAGEEFTFSDMIVDAPGATYSWKFGADASIQTSTNSSVQVSYSQPGHKSATLTVTNSKGCSGTSTYSFLVGSCNPVIPRGARAITGSDNGFTPDSIVWIKSGGSYIDRQEGLTIFAEPGSAINFPGGAGGRLQTWYLRHDVSLTMNTVPLVSTIFEAPSTLLPGFTGISSLDTFFCDNLTFDYSQVQSDVAPSPAQTLSLIRRGDRLIARSEDGPIEVRLINLLGTPLLSQLGTSTLDIDLSQIPAGIYFAVVEAGERWEVRKIAVVH